MPILITDGRPTVFIRREAFERIGLNRAAIDERFNLTDQEFHVEGGLVAIGPLPSDDSLSEMIAALESQRPDLLRRFFRAQRKLAGLAQALLRECVTVSDRGS